MGVNQVITQGNAALFMQPGGASPANAVKTAGIDGQYFIVDGISQSFETTDPIFARDPRAFKKFVAVAAQVSPPDGFDQYDLTERRNADGFLPLQLMRQRCKFDVYMHYGACSDPTNKNNLDFFIQVLPGGVRDGNIESTGTAFDGDDPLEDSGTVKLVNREAFVVGKLNFKQVTTTNAATHMTYGRPSDQCQCSVDQETAWQYVIEASAGATPAIVRYSVNGGATFTNLSITGLLATETVKGIEFVNNSLVVVTATAGGATLSGYYVSPVNEVTGVPSSVWTKVTTGFVANALAEATTTVNGKTLYIACQDGYVFSTSNVLQGVSVSKQGSVTTADLKYISADLLGNNVAVIDTAADIFIAKEGTTIWAALQVQPTVTTVGPLALVDDKTIFVGSASTAGEFQYNTQGGATGSTWTTIVLPVTDPIVRAIQIVNPNVIHLAVTDSTNILGYLVTTWNGGESWVTNGNGRIANFNAYDELLSLAIPQVGSDSTRANALLVGGVTATGNAFTVAKAPVR